MAKDTKQNLYGEIKAFLECPEQQIESRPPHAKLISEIASVFKNYSDNPLEILDNSQYLEMAIRGAKPYAQRKKGTEREERRINEQVEVLDIVTILAIRNAMKKVPVTKWGSIVCQSHGILKPSKKGKKYKSVHDWVLDG